MRRGLLRRARDGIPIAAGFAREHPGAAAGAAVAAADCVPLIAAVATGRWAAISGRLALWVWAAVLQPGSHRISGGSSGKKMAPD